MATFLCGQVVQKEQKKKDGGSLLHVLFRILTIAGCVIPILQPGKAIGDANRDFGSKQEGLSRLEDLLARAMEGKLAIDTVPKQIKKLL